MDDGSGQKSIDPGEIDSWEILFINNADFIITTYRDDPSRALSKPIHRWEDGSHPSLVKNVLLREVCLVG